MRSKPLKMAVVAGVDGLGEKLETTLVVVEGLAIPPLAAMCSTTKRAT